MFRKKYFIYLPNFEKTIIIKAKDEASAIWKLFNRFKLREVEVENYKIVKVL